MMTKRPRAAEIPAPIAAPYPRCGTSITRAPACSASVRESSCEPLSATSTSPATPLRSRKARAFSTHFPTVAASSRHGIRIVSSTPPPRPGDLKKKRYPEGYLFPKLSLLLAAAGARQEFRRHTGRGSRAAVPAEQGLAGVGGKRRRHARGLQRRQLHDRAVDRGGDVGHRRGYHAHVGRGDRVDVLGAGAGADFAAPVV